MISSTFLSLSCQSFKLIKQVPVLAPVPSVNISYPAKAETDCTPSILSATFCNFSATSFVRSNDEPGGVWIIA